jgi:hypothetical protein
MPKLVLTDLANLNNPATVVATVNTNNSAIEIAIENTLSRDGSVPNTMGATLDMNSNRIVNLPQAGSNTEPLRLIDYLTGGLAPAGPESWATPIAYTSGISARALPPRTTVVFNGETYVCTTSHTTTGVFDSSKWILVAQKGVGVVTNGDKGDITVSGSGDTWVIDSGVVTFPKMQNIANARLLGRTTAASGVIEELTTGPALSLAAGSLNVATGGITFTMLSTAGIATAAQWRSNTTSLLLTTDQVWASAAFVALTDAATIAVDLSSGINLSVTLGGNRTLGNPTNTKVGQSGMIRVTQDATGGRTLAFASNYKFAGGTAFGIDTTANRTTYLSYFVNSSTEIVITGAAGVR